MKTLALVFCVVAVLASGKAGAQEKVRVSISSPGLWDTGVVELGSRSGIFKKHGFDLEIFYTAGGAESQQAVIAGSADIATGLGISGAVGAYAKGAPLRIISAEMTGASDLLWYVLPNSPIKTIADLSGKSLAYSLAGTSSHAGVLELIRQYKLDAKTVSTGNAPATFTQVMTGQVDMGWATAPFAVDAILDGRVRLLARGSDVDALKSRTTRVNIASLEMIEKRMPTIQRFMVAYREALDWMYANPEALRHYAEYSKLPMKVVEKIPEILPKENLNPDQIVGIDQVISDAVAQKFLSKPLDQKQIDDMIKMPSKS